MTVAIGDTVKWNTSKTALGIVIHKFYHKLNMYAVVERTNGTLVVVRIYEALQVVKGGFHD